MPPKPAQSDSGEAREWLNAALRAVAMGDQSALRTVYDLTSAKLFGICVRISGNTQEAEDVLQDVYVKVWRQAGRFDPMRASPITWLATIARNAAIDRRRAEGRHAGEPEDAAASVPDAAPLADTLIDAEQGRARIFACLAGLEERQAGAIRAAFFDGLTYAELAERMATPLGTMKSWIRRGLAKLKDCIGDE